MARPTQNTIDYFSHDCNHKQTMYILENKYKNDGYAFWFKLLESLGSAPNHFLDLNDEIACEFLAAKTNLSWNFCDEILTLLAKINAICPKLWVKKIVWCQKFVDRMAGVYAKRKKDLPIKPSFCDKNDSITVVSVTETPQSKLKEIRVNKINNTPADFEKSANDSPKISAPKENHKKEIDNQFNQFWELYPKKADKKKSLAKFTSILKNKEATFEEIMEGLENYAQSKVVKDGFPKHATTWLNGACWQDEHEIFVDPKQQAIDAWLADGPSDEELEKMELLAIEEEKKRANSVYHYNK